MQTQRDTGPCDSMKGNALLWGWVLLPAGAVHFILWNISELDQAGWWWEVRITCFHWGQMQLRVSPYSWLFLSSPASALSQRHWETKSYSEAIHMGCVVSRFLLPFLNPSCPHCLSQGAHTFVFCVTYRTDSFWGSNPLGSPVGDFHPPPHHQEQSLIFSPWLTLNLTCLALIFLCKLEVWALLYCMERRKRWWPGRRLCFWVTWKPHPPPEESPGSLF